MMRPDRVTLALVSLALATACGSPRGPAAACSGDEQCGAAARCVSDTCVANSPPQASFSTQGDLVSNAVVTLDATASTDPDDQDEVTSFAWTVEAVGARCAPPVVADTTAIAKVRFGCAGSYAVHLVVKDTMGAESPEVTKNVGVAAGPSSLVNAGADQTVLHGCSGSPLRCGLVTAVKLAGAVSAAPAGAVTYQWTAVPPANRPLDATRRVRFSPSANVLDPAVEVETDGTPISGDWVFRLEVRDGISALGSADMRLSVGNRPPVVDLAAQHDYPHHYDPATRTYSSAGTVSAQVSDPDGDPVARKVEWRHTGDGGGQFDGVDGGTAVSFRIAVTDAPSLAGSGLERAVSVAADDGNGGATTGSVPVLVGNRPPALAGTTRASASHTFTAATETFSSVAAVGTWVDPDGDPLTGVPATGDPECASALEADGTARVTCAATRAGLDSLAQFVGLRTFDVHARDPWDVGTGTAALTIGDRPPFVSSVTLRPTMSCVREFAGLCCEPLYSQCLQYGDEHQGGSFSLPLGVTDPDGDPLQVWAQLVDEQLPLSVTCVRGACAASLYVPPVQTCASAPASHTVAIQVSDGVTLANGAVAVSPGCR
jgi:hypothetical protein